MNKLDYSFLNFSAYFLFLFLFEKHVAVESFALRVYMLTF